MNKLNLEKNTAMVPSSSNKTPSLFVPVAAFVGVMLIMGIIYTMVNNSIQKLNKETNEYRKALTYIADNQATYQKNSAQKEAMREKLLNADAKIGTRITTTASSIGLTDITVNPKDAKPTSDDSGAEVQEVEIQLKNVDYAKCVDFLVQIHKLDSPIYMQHINMSRTSNLNSSDTKMSVSITLLSYRLKEQT